jgi:hypothetical protein
MNFSERIQKLNVIEKLLKGDLVSVKLSLGEEAVVREVNEEIKQFLLASVEAILSGESSAQFTPQEVLVLKEFVRKMMEKAAPKAAPETLVNTSAPLYSAPPVTPRRSPVLDALRAHGFNPTASVEERKAAIKSAEKKK